jgi:RNA polymerase sigma factor (sigma-70 family)
MTTESWLSDLFENTYVLLYRVGRLFVGASQKELIEDQIQETFLLAWRYQHKLLKHPNPAGWLVEAFRRCLLSQLRKMGREWKRRAFSLDEDDRPEYADRNAPPAESFAENQEQLALLRRLLGEKDAEIFLHYCVLGESSVEVAARCGMSDACVRMRVSRLKRKLLENKELFLCVALLLAMGTFK